MCEMLKLNGGPCDITLSDLIRLCALILMNYRGHRCIAATGAMVVCVFVLSPPKHLMNYKSADLMDLNIETIHFRLL